jgi:hypothetical protein
VLFLPANKREGESAESISIDRMVSFIKRLAQIEVPLHGSTEGIGETSASRPVRDDPQVR